MEYQGFKISTRVAGMEGFGYRLPPACMIAV